MPEQPEKKTPDADEEFQKLVTGITERFVKQIYGAIAEARGEPSPVTDEDEEGEEITAKKPTATEADWDKLLSEAVKLLGDTPAYVVIALDRLSPEGAPTMIVPRVFHASREPEYSLIVQAQLATVLAGLTEQTVQRILQQKASNGDS